MVNFGKYIGLYLDNFVKCFHTQMMTFNLLLCFCNCSIGVVNLFEYLVSFFFRQCPKFVHWIVLIYFLMYVNKYFHRFILKGSILRTRFTMAKSQMLNVHKKSLLTFARRDFRVWARIRRGVPPWFARIRSEERERLRGRHPQRPERSGVRRVQPWTFPPQCRHSQSPCSCLPT